MSTGSGSRPGPVSAPVRRPDGRLDDQRTALAEHRHIAAGSGVLPHFGVHGGGKDLRTGGGQQGGREQVIGATGDGARQQVGGGGNDENQIRAATETDMWDLVGRRPHICGDGSAGEGGPGGLSDKTKRRLGGKPP